MNIANVIMENLLQQKKAQAAMVLDALFVADLHLWPFMDISTILAYFGLSEIFMGESVLRRGIVDLVQKGILETRQILSRAKGRPRWQYRVKKEAAIAEILGVKFHRDENRDSIPLEAFQTTRLYRGSKHYSFLRRLGESTLSRKKLGARLGVGGRSTFNYEIGKKLEVTQRVETEELKEFDIKYAPTTRPKNNVFLRVEWQRQMTEDELAESYKEYNQSDWRFFPQKTTDYCYMPYTAFILERELKRGNRVFKTKQITNVYKVA